MKRTGPPEPAGEWAKATRAAMADAHLSQDAVAAILGVGQSTIARWLTEPAPPPPLTVFRLEEVLGLRPGTLSRLLGYLPPIEGSGDVEAALASDPALTDVQRRLLAGMYRELVDGAR